MLRLKIAFTLLIIANIGCGAKETADALEAEIKGRDCTNSALVGTWVSESWEDLLRFNADCSGSSSYCESTFAYPEDTTSESGRGTINILETENYASCMPKGEASCDYEIGIDDDGYKYLQLFCKQGTMLYYEH